MHASALPRELPSIHHRVTGRSGLTGVPQGKTLGKEGPLLSAPQRGCFLLSMSAEAVRGRAQTFLRAEQKYCCKIPFRDAERCSWESHFTQCGEAEMPGEAWLVHGVGGGS